MVIYPLEIHQAGKAESQHLSEIS